MLIDHEMLLGMNGRFAAKSGHSLDARFDPEVPHIRSRA
jgi:hypothetical protein